MSTLKSLVELAGEWHGINQLYLSESPMESPSTMLVTPILGDRFVRFDQTWSHDGDPQTGSLLLGFDGEGQKASAHWVDTFHMGNKVIACVGGAPTAELFDTLGSFEVPPGPPWGWRIQIVTSAPEKFTLRMYNIHPDGEVDLAVQAEFSRTKT